MKEIDGKASEGYLKNVPSHNTRHNFKQIKGGNVTNTQPPSMCGFFIPATSGDCTELSGVARNKIPSSGNTCSVSFDALEGTRQLYCCCNFKQIKDEVNAMQAATTHATGTPSAGSSTSCLIHSHTLTQVIEQAQQQRRIEGRGHAYVHLLRIFHKAILPIFIGEAAGSKSEAARLLGIHRGTLNIYLQQAGLEVQV